jgi:Uma2 family endonuclease
MAIPTRHMTLEEFLEMPEREPPLEYLFGRVTQKVSPQGKHGRLEYAICSSINGFAEPRRLAIAIPELRTTFSDGSPVPDIAVYRWDRLQLDADGRIADRYRAPPDMAIEILSPGQSIRKLIEKAQWFVANGTLIALVVDPYRERVRRLRHGEPAQVLRGSDRIDLDEVLPGFELTAQQLFEALYPGWDPSARDASGRAARD